MYYFLITILLPGIFFHPFRSQIIWDTICYNSILQFTLHSTALICYNNSIHYTNIYICIYLFSNLFVMMASNFNRRSLAIILPSGKTLAYIVYPFNEFMKCLLVLFPSIDLDWCHFCLTFTIFGHPSINPRSKKYSDSVIFIWSTA